MTLPFDFTPKKAEDEGPPRSGDKPDEPKALSVAELDRALKGAVEGCFEQAVWVEGEITGARPATSGHLYFCLKDEKEDASIDVVVYKTNVFPRARLLVKDGARIRVRGRPTFWAPRGKLQLVGDRIAPAGRGALLEALERLKAKLSEEGLFDPSRKRPLPREPRIIGVVTSAGGAVIHDVCKVAFRRGGAHILLAAATVQGEKAADSIRRALGALQRVQGVDAIIVGRGGGSADELMPFNDEEVVRAVARCHVPVVSAVGHEVDVTLTDFAADARAATPSQAAEMLVPDRTAMRDRLAHGKARLLRAMRMRITEDRVRAGDLARRLGDPRLALAHHQQLLDDRESRLAAAIRALLRARHAELVKTQHKLALQHPQAVLAREQAAIARLADRLAVIGQRLTEKRRASLASATARLDALSPLKVLARGYAIAVTGDGRAVRGAADVKPGDTLSVRVQSARIEAEVTRVEEVS